MREPELQNFIDRLAADMFGRSHSEAGELGVCVTCGEKVTAFRDALSEKEWHISRMCQQCQDKTFA